MVRAGQQQGIAAQGAGLGPAAFDPEDFLGLRGGDPAAPESPERALPPMVTPPLYDRDGPNRMARVSAPRRAEAVSHAPGFAIPQPEAPRRAAAAEGPTPIATPPVYDRRGRPALVEAPVAQPVPQSRMAAPAQRSMAPQPVALPAAPTDIATPPSYDRRGRPVPEAQAPIPLRPMPAPTAAPVQDWATDDWAEAAPINAPVAPDWIPEAAAPAPMAASIRRPAPVLPIQSRRAAPQRPVQDHDFLDLPPADFHHGDTPPTAIAAHPAQEPMEVRIGGIGRRALAYSAAGVALEAPLSTAIAGRVQDLTLLVGQGATRLRLDVAALAEARPGQSVQSFAFVELDALQAHLLHRLGDEGVPLDRLLVETRMPAPAAPLPTAKQAKAPKTAKAKPARKRGFGMGRAHLLFVFAAIALGGGAIWNANSVIPARYAVLSAGDTMLSSPVSGLVTALDLTPGQSVLRGQVVGRVETAAVQLSPEMLDRRSGMLDEVAALESRRAAIVDPEAEPALLQAIDARLSHLQTELSRIAIGATGQGEAILAPCDCLVESVTIPASGEITAGQALAELSGGAGAGVQALIRDTEAQRIAPGHRVHITLADGARVDGTVTGIASNRDMAGFEALGETIFAVERYARLDITLDAPVSGAAGQAVGVTVQTSAVLAFVQEQSRAAMAALAGLVGM